MRIAITQPNFLPWLGYFELLDSVDCFVALDDVQLVRRSFVVRNRAGGPGREPLWLSMAIQSCPTDTSLSAAYPARDRPWWRKLERQLEAHYIHAPHWPRLKPWLRDALPPREEEPVAAYNLRLLQDLAAMSGCAPARWHRASELVPPDTTNNHAERLAAICHALGAQDYLNFRKGIDIGLHSAEFFAAHGIRLWRQDYRHPVYPQGGSGFVERLSVIDLLAHVGADETAEVIRSGRSWTQMPVAGAA